MPESVSVNSRRLIRRAGLLLAVAILVIVLIPAGLGWLSLWGITHPPCAPGPRPQDFGLTAEEALIPMRTGFSHPGYFFRGTNGATIIVPPAYSQDRGGMLHEVAILVRNGYSVLTYDGRPCMGMAPHSLGIWEAEDILATLDYLSGREDVDMTRIGAHGFSQAGASALFAAARAPTIRAVLAEGGYLDYGPQTLGIGEPSDLFMTLFQWGARAAYRAATGLSLSDLRLIEALTQIAPRKVLLVYGEHDVTLSGARAAAADNPEHVRLWYVPGADHGTYLVSAGETVFTEHVIGFFDQALAPLEG